VTDSHRSALLVASRPARRRRIAAALEGQGITVVAEIDDPDEALPLLEQCEPSVLVIELSTGQEGSDLVVRNAHVLDFVGAARKRAPGLRVIAVTESLDPGLVADAATRGVDAYVLEPNSD